MKTGGERERAGRLPFATERSAADLPSYRSFVRSFERATAAAPSRGVLSPVANQRPPVHAGADGGRALPRPGMGLGGDVLTFSR